MPDTTAQAPPRRSFSIAESLNENDEDVDVHGFPQGGDSILGGEDDGDDKDDDDMGDEEDGSPSEERASKRTKRASNDITVNGSTNTKGRGKGKANGKDKEQEQDGQDGQDGQERESKTRDQRKVQNRIAQREFRQRKQAYVKDLEARVEFLSASRDEQIQALKSGIMALIEENKQLRKLLGQVSGFIGEGVGGRTGELGFTASEFERLLNQGERETVRTAMHTAVAKLGNNNTSANGAGRKKSGGDGTKTGQKRKLSCLTGDDSRDEDPGSSKSIPSAFDATPDDTRPGGLLSRHSQSETIDPNGKFVIRGRDFETDPIQGHPIRSYQTGGTSFVGLASVAMDRAGVSPKEFFEDIHGSNLFLPKMAEGARKRGFSMPRADPQLGMPTHARGNRRSGGEDDENDSPRSPEELRASTSPQDPTSRNNYTNQLVTGPEPSQSLSAGFAPIPIESQMATLLGPDFDPASLLGPRAISRPPDTGMLDSGGKLPSRDDSTPDKSADTSSAPPPATPGLAGGLPGLGLRRSNTGGSSGVTLPSIHSLPLPGLGFRPKTDSPTLSTQSMARPGSSMNFDETMFGVSADSPKLQAFQMLNYHITNSRHIPDYKLPPCLKRTHLQDHIPHEPFIDCIIWSSMRDSLIQNRNKYDMMDFCRAYLEAAVIHSEDVLDPSSWELNEYFLRKYPFLIDDSILSICNRWRADRFEPSLTMADLRINRPQSAQAALAESLETSNRPSDRRILACLGRPGSENERR